METWEAHQGPQTEFLSRGEFEVLFGGAAGPGKTDCLIMAPLRYVRFPRFRGLIIRRTFPQLQEIIDRTRHWYPKFDSGCYYRATEHRWHFTSGASIQVGHCQHEDDIYNYQGKEFHWIGFDEVTQFTEKQYLYLFSRCRSTIAEIPSQIRATTNPGGVGHVWCKGRFIDVAKPYETYIDPNTGLSRTFIPATVDDNPTLFETDPAYIKRLEALPEIEKLRLRFGSWDIFEGQAFPELSMRMHGCEPFIIPPEWEKFMVLDWGYSKPFSCGWYAVDYDGVLYRYREYYGCKDNEVDQGLKMTPIEVARNIIEREREKLKFRVADPACWHASILKDRTQGPSIIEEMGKEGLFFLKADNDRRLGKIQVHNRLKLEEDIDQDTGEVLREYPRTVIFNSHQHFWRTMTELRLDVRQNEDVDCFVKGTEIKTPEGTRFVEDIKIGDLVCTPIGNRKVVKAGVSGKSERVIEVLLSNGKKLKGTANHCVFVKGKGLVELQKITETDELQTTINIRHIWNLGRLSTKVLHTAKAKAVDIIDQTGHILNKATLNCIWKFIKTITEIFQRGMTSIISTTIATITPRIISLPSPNIYMRDITANCSTLSREYGTGIRRIEGRPYCAKTQKKWSVIRQKGNARAEIVTILLRLNTLQRVIAKTARTCGDTLKRYVPSVDRAIWEKMEALSLRKPVHMVAVGNYEDETVYRLTVEEAHLYYANGVLVTNTDQEDHIYDEFRYACMTRPVIPKRTHVVPPGSFAAERSRYIKAKKYAQRHGVSLEVAYARVR